MKSEGDVKAAVKKILDEAGVYWFMPVQTGYGRSGIPDIIACCKGRYLAIETKFKYGKPTAHQTRELASTEAAGGIALVINERNLEELERVLASIGR